jgi:aminoglycoside phosphotransferase family enzyme/predicted kinase
VYKLKKPVDLGFLDFSTLEKRRHFLNEEIRLNRRLSPQLYVDVLPVYGNPWRPQLAARGDVFEYVLRMRPFPQRAQLDRLLQSHGLEADQMRSLGEYLARFHLGAGIASADSEFGSLPVVWAPMAENFRQIRGLVNDAVVTRRLKSLEAWSKRQRDRLETSLQQRKAQGFIRECHGDLHLRNLAWMDDAPLAFDCIEFAPELYWIDVINDLAFLWMDLHYHGQQELAWVMLNRYLEISGDFAGLELLQWYAVYRAMVRAKIAAISLSQVQAEGEDVGPAQADLLRHLDLAERFLQPAKPVALLLHGPSASGKSTLSRGLAPLLPAVVLRSDVERKRLFLEDPQQGGKAEFGDGIYSAEASEKTYRRLCELMLQLVGAGYSVLVDATFGRHQERERFIAVLAAQHYPYLILDLQVPEAELQRRIIARSGDVSDADLGVLQQQLISWRGLEPSERTHALEIDMTGEPDLPALLARIESQRNRP